ncbi:MAG: glycine zipper 2TM domain-containing protein [Pseudomonadota bacterium]
MSKRLAFLAAASPLALLAAPVQAQVDDHYAATGEIIETYSEPVVQDIGGWESEAGASYADGDYADHADGHGNDAEGEWRDMPRGAQHHMGGHGRRSSGYHGAAMAQPRQLAYSPAERAEWLGQCRALHASQDEPVYVEYERDRDGDIIGGVLGAVAGGVVGNRVANRGDRLAGTLIGAGLGGIAGAVIGSVIDNIGGDDDDYRVLAPQEPGFDYCEAYLINYERGYGTSQQVAYAPVMMVPVQGQAMHGQMTQGHGGARRMIVEEVEVEAEAPQHHRARRVIHRQPAGDKRTPTR